MKIALPCPTNNNHDIDHIANTLQLSDLSLEQEVSYLAKIARNYIQNEIIPTETCYASCEPFGIIQADL